MSIKETKDGVILTVFVKTNSSKFRIQMEDNQITLHCTQEPVKGKVNKEIIKELTKLFHAKAELASGFTSKEKQIAIAGIRKTQAEQILSTTLANS